MTKKRQLNNNKSIQSTESTPKIHVKYTRLDSVETKIDIPEADEGPEEDNLSDNESEDETGKYITPELTSQFIKTLALLKTKDKRIYSKVDINNQKEIDEARLNWSKKTNKNSKTYEHETETTINPCSDKMVDTPDDSEFFTEKTKSEKEIEIEEDKYKQFIMEEINKYDTDKNTLKEWVETKLNNKDDKDSFLINFLVNKMWVGKDDKNILPNTETDNESDETFANSSKYYKSTVRKSKKQKSKLKQSSKETKQESKTPNQLDSIYSQIQKHIETLNNLTNNTIITTDDFNNMGYLDFPYLEKRIEENKESLVIENKSEIQDAYKTMKKEKDSNSLLVKVLKDIKIKIQEYSELLEIYNLNTPIQ